MNGGEITEWKSNEVKYFSELRIEKSAMTAVKLIICRRLVGIRMRKKKLLKLPWFKNQLCRLGEVGGVEAAGGGEKLLLQLCCKQDNLTFKEHLQLD